MHKIRVHLIQLFCLKKTKGFANGAHVLRFGKVFNLLTDNHPPNFLLTYLILLQNIQKGIIFQAKGAGNTLFQLTCKCKDSFFLICCEADPYALSYGSGSGIWTFFYTDPDPRK